MFNRNRDDLPTLRITSLSTEADEDDLREMFGRYGRIARANVVRDRDTQESKGFAFVSFESRADGEKALKAWDGRGESGKRGCLRDFPGERDTDETFRARSQVTTTSSCLSAGLCPVNLDPTREGGRSGYSVKAGMEGFFVYAIDPYFLRDEIVFYRSRDISRGLDERAVIVRV
jgi:hypothetical protein